MAHNPHDHSPEPGEPYEKALERLNRFQEPEGRAAIADLGLTAGSRGLDVGCGVGLYTLWLVGAVEPGGRVLGIERAAERVEAARNLVGALAPGRLDFSQGDGTAIDATDGAFDWVWCGDALHHIQETGVALKEFIRVVRPGGLIVVKESQVMPAVFLPGHPDLERRIQAAEIERQREEAGGSSFPERRQRTPASMREAGLADVRMRTYLIQRRAPLDPTARDYIERVVFARNWGPRLRDLLAPDDWRQRSALCEPDSSEFVLARPDYYCLYSLSVFTATRPA